MKLYKKILLALLFVLIVIQFIQPARNVSKKILPADITKICNVPDSVQAILKTACYDCHSNNTSYPWYFNVQPLAWFMANHIKDGKADLNFSEFGSYTKRRQKSKLKSIASQVKDGEMPILSYTLMHKDADLSEDEKTLIIEWATKTKDSLSVKN